MDHRLACREILKNFTGQLIVDGIAQIDQHIRFLHGGPGLFGADAAVQLQPAAGRKLFHVRRQLRTHTAIQFAQNMQADILRHGIHQGKQIFRPADLVVKVTGKQKIRFLPGKLHSGRASLILHDAGKFRGAQLMAVRRKLRIRVVLFQQRGDHHFVQALPGKQLFFLGMDASIDMVFPIGVHHISHPQEIHPALCQGVDGVECAAAGNGHIDRLLTVHRFQQRKVLIFDGIIACRRTHHIHAGRNRVPQQTPCQVEQAVILPVCTQDLMGDPVDGIIKPVIGHAVHAFFQRVCRIFAVSKNADMVAPGAEFLRQIPADRQVGIEVSGCVVTQKGNVHSGSPEHKYRNRVLSRYKISNLLYHKTRPDTILFL